MYYAVLTKIGEDGSPFKRSQIAPTAPGEPLRISEKATLIAFPSQPARLLSRNAGYCGYLLWHVNEETIHPDDMPAEEVFETTNAFTHWLMKKKIKDEKKHQQVINKLSTGF